jgi:DNA-binding NarL/FixJ family response regulator
VDETNQKIRVLIAGDQDQTGSSLAAMLNCQPDITVVAEAADGNAIVELCSQEKPDVVLLDLQMTGTDAVEVLKGLKARPEPAQVIGLTGVFHEEELFCVLEAGARGYFLKDLRQNDLLEAVRAVHRGCRWVALVVAGRPAAWLGRGEIDGHEFGVLKLLPHAGYHQKDGRAGVRSKEAVMSQLKVLFERLGVHEDSQAAIRALLR